MNEGTNKGIQDGYSIARDLKHGLWFTAQKSRWAQGTRRVRNLVLGLTLKPPATFQSRASWLKTVRKINKKRKKPDCSYVILRTLALTGIPLVWVWPLLQTGVLKCRHFPRGWAAVWYPQCAGNFSHSTAEINTHYTKNLNTCHIIILKFYST